MHEHSIINGFTGGLENCRHKTGAVNLLDGDNKDRDLSPTFSMARAIEATAWRKVNVI